MSDTTRELMKLLNRNAREFTTQHKRIEVGFRIMDPTQPVSRAMLVVTCMCCKAQVQLPVPVKTKEDMVKNVRRLCKEMMKEYPACQE